MPTEHIEVDDRAFLASFHAGLEELKLDAIEQNEKVTGKVVELAEGFAPVRTGALKADIHASPFVRTAKGGFNEITAGTREAPFQEFGTTKMKAHPFMRPALAMAAGALRSIGVSARLASTPAARAALRRARQRQRVRRAVLRVRRRPSHQATSLLVAEQFRLGVLERQARLSRRHRRR